MDERQSDWHAAAELGGSVWDRYERDLVPAIFGTWVNDLVELAHLQGGERVLDVACGTGVVARGVRQALGDAGIVAGSDINRDMLEVARAAAGPLAIEWRQADACALPFADSDFDVVMCQQGLQFVPDRAVALGEMFRVLTTGGRAVVAVWSPIERSPGFGALADAIERSIGAEAAGGLRRGPFGYGSSEKLEGELAAAGFRDVRVQTRQKAVRFPSSDEFVLRYAMGSPLAPAFSSASDEVRMQVITEVSTALEEFTSAGELTFPIASHLGVGLR